MYTVFYVEYNLPLVGYILSIDYAESVEYNLAQ